MLLVIDIGNTNAVLGLYAGEGLQHHFRVESARGRTSDEYAATLHTLLAMKGVRPGDVRASVIACVVPALQEVFVRVVRDFEYTGTQKILVRNLKAVHFRPSKVEDPLYWRERGDQAFKPLTDADYARLREQFVHAERLPLLER